MRYAQGGGLTDAERTTRTAQLSAFVHLLTHTPAGRVITELIGQAQTDPELANALRTRYSDPRRRLAVEAMHRAQERGQLRPDADCEALVDQLWGACYHRMLLSDLPLTEGFTANLLANVLHGVAPRTPPAP